MDCVKLIAFGARHAADWWVHIEGKDSYGLERLSLILLPTYPSSGSKYGLGAVAADPQSGVFGTAFGIAADHAILVPGYSLSLGKELTAYTGLVTLVQLSASMLKDQNLISCDAGISVIRNVQKAVRRLMNHLDDLDARGVILYDAFIATSDRLGSTKKKITAMTSMRSNSSRKRCLASSIARVSRRCSLAF